MVRVHGEQPWRGSEGSQGMSEVMRGEDEERLGRAPRGTPTQMVMRGNKKVELLSQCRPRHGNYYRKDILKVSVCCVNVSYTFKLALLH